MGECSLFSTEGALCGCLGATWREAENVTLFLSPLTFWSVPCNPWSVSHPTLRKKARGSARHSGLNSDSGKRLMSWLHSWPVEWQWPKQALSSEPSTSPEFPRQSDKAYWPCFHDFMPQIRLTLHFPPTPVCPPNLPLGVTIQSSNWSAISTTSYHHPSPWSLRPGGWTTVNVTLVSHLFTSIPSNVRDFGSGTCNFLTKRFMKWNHFRTFPDTHYSMYFIF